MARINVIFEKYLLKLTVFLVRGKGAQNMRKKERTDTGKTLKNEEKEKQRINGK